MLSILLFIFVLILMVFFNAVMDAIENENIGESIFKNLNPSFWSKRESSNSAKKIFTFTIFGYKNPGYKVDAWHLSKTLMVICIPALVSIGIHISPLLLFPLIGIIWNFFFWLFYHVLFKVK